MAGTVAELLERAATRYGEATAIILGDHKLTYRELEERSRLYAAGLLGRGVGKGSRVGILFGNGPQWLLWWAALTRMGAVVVPLSTFARGLELGRVIRHADLHGIVLQQEFLGRDQVATLEAALPGLSGSDRAISLSASPYLRWAVVDGDGQVPDWARDVDWVLEGAVGAAVQEAAQTEIHEEDLALVIYTSGQSSDPKGVTHSHRTVVMKTEYLQDMLSIEGGVRVSVVMPFFWVGGLVMALLPGLLAGATIVCQERSTFGQPVIGSGKEPVNPYPEGTLLPSLGMTETFGMYSWSRDWRAPGSELAPPLDILEPGYEVKVVDGELLVRGPTVTKGLLKVDRALSFDPDGFYRTGDGGRVYQGRLHFTGRLGDMIKTSGANVSPAEVEQELSQLEGVDNAFVVALDHPSRGQEVVGAVVPVDGTSLDTSELRRLLRERLSGYKVPRRLALLQLAEVPRTPSQKIDKRALADLIAERIPLEDAG